MTRARSVWKVWQDQKIDCSVFRWGSDKNEEAQTMDFQKLGWEWKERDWVLAGGHHIVERKKYFFYGWHHNSFLKCQYLVSCAGYKNMTEAQMRGGVEWVAMG